MRLRKRLFRKPEEALWEVRKGSSASRKSACGDVGKRNLLTGNVFRKTPIIRVYAAGKSFAHCKGTLAELTVNNYAKTGKHYAYSCKTPVTPTETDGGWGGAYMISYRKIYYIQKRIHNII